MVRELSCLEDVGVLRQRLRLGLTDEEGAWGGWVGRVYSVGLALRDGGKIAGVCVFKVCVCNATL